METKRKLFFPLLVLCMGIVLCVSLTSIFFSLSVTKKATDSASILSSISYNIYLLSTNKSSLEKEAVQLGKDGMINNYAGYIWEQDGFNCIASGYKNENDATLVKNKLEKENISSNIIKISFPSIKISASYSTEERDILSSSLNSFHDCYSALYDISISLDGALSNETSAMLSINNELSKFEKTRNNFNTLFPTATNEFITIIKNYLTDGHESLSLLASKTLIVPTQTFSSLIKYRYCEILDLNYNLIQNIINL